MDTASLNFPKQTRASWSLLKASGLSVKFKIAILKYQHTIWNLWLTLVHTIMIGVTSWSWGMKSHVFWWGWESCCLAKSRVIQILNPAFRTLCTILYQHHIDIIIGFRGTLLQQFNILYAYSSSHFRWLPHPPWFPVSPQTYFCWFARSWEISKTLEPYSIAPCQARIWWTPLYHGSIGETCLTFVWDYKLIRYSKGSQSIKVAHHRGRRHWMVEASIPHIPSPKRTANTNNLEMGSALEVYHPIKHRENRLPVCPLHSFTRFEKPYGTPGRSSISGTYYGGLLCRWHGSVSYGSRNAN